MPVATCRRAPRSEGSASSTARRFCASTEYVFQGATFEGGDYALLPAEGFASKDNRQVPLYGGTYLMRLDYADDIARISIDQVVLNDPGAVRVEVKTGAEVLPEGSGEPTTAVDWLGSERRFSPWVDRG